MPIGFPLSANTVGRFANLAQQAPFIGEVEALIHRAARLFPYSRVIGWDIAIAPDRPWIIEGNMWPSFVPIQHVSGGMRDTPIVKELGAKLGWRLSAPSPA